MCIHIWSMVFHSRPFQYATNSFDRTNTRKNTKWRRNQQPTASGLGISQNERNILCDFHIRSLGRESPKQNKHDKAVEKSENF